jgi:mersacidin/lichenicidin family type 2 lantibiotic
MMPTATMTRAWTDVEFRAELTVDERELVPEHPAGDVDAELSQLVSQEATWQTTNCTYWSGGTRCCC